MYKSTARFVDQSGWGRNKIATLRPFVLVTYYLVRRYGKTCVCRRAVGWGTLFVAQRALARLKYGYAEILHRKGEEFVLVEKTGDEDLKRRYDEKGGGESPPLM